MDKDRSDLPVCMVRVELTPEETERLQGVAALTMRLSDRLAALSLVTKLRTEYNNAALGKLRQFVAANQLDDEVALPETSAETALSGFAIRCTDHFMDVLRTAKVPGIGPLIRDAPIVKPDARL
ncbi:MAG TPA: hypothetical protein VIF12_00400 [Micavibrio sp.]|jgi:hypothetical protein